MDLTYLQSLAEPIPERQATDEDERVSLLVLRKADAAPDPDAEASEDSGRAIIELVEALGYDLEASYLVSYGIDASGPPAVGTLADLNAGLNPPEPEG